MASSTRTIVAPRFSDQWKIEASKILANEACDLVVYRDVPSVMRGATWKKLAHCGVIRDVARDFAYGRSDLVESLRDAPDWFAALNTCLKDGDLVHYIGQHFVQQVYAALAQWVAQNVKDSAQIVCQDVRGTRLLANTGTPGVTCVLGVPTNCPCDILFLRTEQLDAIPQDVLLQMCRWVVVYRGRAPLTTTPNRVYLDVKSFCTPAIDVRTIGQLYEAMHAMASQARTWDKMLT